ncbi:hypothetical protein CDL15_Pgr008333 [Punica granatum]|uniref:Uncharacterized protein n=1 Tax=Punica granatum TaxID=22663 RepID=A0A218XS79_PUNGR|nr:hypothetical protein CDL15_Pgr008333 [Punica granatum]
MLGCKGCTFGCARTLGARAGTRGHARARGQALGARGEASGGARGMRRVCAGVRGLALDCHYSPESDDFAQNARVKEVFKSWMTQLNAWKGAWV